MDFKSIFELEKKLVFLINFGLVLLVITTFLFDFNLSYFFYFNVILTSVLGYFYFKRSRKLSKTLILTNMFIFFYFLYPYVADFLSKLLGSQGYIYILFYSVLISYVFLVFSGNDKTFIGNLSKFSYKIAGGVFLIGAALGFLFYLIHEPVPSLFVDIVSTGSFFDFLKFIVFSSFIIGLSEQMIFSGFLHNSYRSITSKWDAMFQVSILFVCFHLLRFEVLVKHYFANFEGTYIFFITSYYVLLFIFMVCAQYFYTFKSKKYEGNFFYPVILHFGADLSLFFFYLATVVFMF